MYFHIVLVQLIKKSSPYLVHGIKINKFSSVYKIPKMQDGINTIFNAVWEKCFFKELKKVIGKKL